MVFRENFASSDFPILKSRNGGRKETDSGNRNKFRVQEDVVALFAGFCRDKYFVRAFWVAITADGGIILIRRHSVYMACCRILDPLFTHGALTMAFADAVP